MELSRILIIVAIIVLLFFLIRYIASIGSSTLTSLNDARSSVVIPSTSLTTDSNGSSSTNFTYSIWFYISDWNYRYGKNKVIFTRSASASTDKTYDGEYMTSSSCGTYDLGCKKNSKTNLPSNISGAATYDATYIRSLCETSTYGCCPYSVFNRVDAVGTNCSLPGGAKDPCPTMYLGATENNLYYQLTLPDRDSSSENILYTVGVSNVPIQRWVHAVLCVYDRTVEIYIDGKLSRTSVMPNVMTTVSSNGNIILSPAAPGATSSLTGFSGYTSNLTYYPNPITPQEVWNLYKKGPGSSMGGSTPNYSVQVSLYDGNLQKSSYTLSGSGLTNSQTTKKINK